MNRACFLMMILIISSCGSEPEEAKEDKNQFYYDTASAITKEADPSAVADTVELQKELTDSAAFKKDPLQSLTTHGGVKINFIERGNGSSLQKGDVVKIKYTGRLKDGKIFDSSDMMGRSLPFYIGIGMSVKGWDEALVLMRAGDKAKLEIPASLGYGKKGYGKLIPPNAELFFDLEVVEKMEPEITDGGLYFYKTLEKDGEHAKEGQTAKIHYYGWLENGKQFDASYFYGKTYDFVIGKGKAIEGWNIALKKMTAGEKAIIVVPPSLGYGNSGIPELVPPNSTLIYNLELVALL